MRAKIFDYLEQIGERPTPWATKNRFSPVILTRVKQGKEISLRNAVMISRLTGGRVLPEDFLFENGK